jgi:hypothetical protein
MNIHRLTLLVTAALMMTACAVPSVRQTIERPEATPQPSPAASEPIVRTLPGSGVQETPLTVKPLPQTAPPVMPEVPLEPGIERAPVTELPAPTEQGSPVAQRPAAARGTQLALATPAPTGGAAVKALAKRADGEIRGNDLMAAAATLERALRIEPEQCPALAPAGTGAAATAAVGPGRADGAEIPAPARRRPRPGRRQLASHRHGPPRAWRPGRQSRGGEPGRGPALSRHGPAPDSAALHPGYTRHAILAHVAWLQARSAGIREGPAPRATE